MLVLTCQRISTDYQTDNITQVRHVIATYVQYMLERSGRCRDYTIQQMQQWLRWLGRQMDYHNQNMFHPKNIQPVFLETEREQHLYDFFALRLPIILLGIVLGSVVSALCRGYLNLPALLLYGSCGGMIADGQYTNRRSLFERPSHRHRAIFHKILYLLAFLVLFAMMMKIGKKDHEQHIVLPLVPVIFFLIFSINKILLQLFLKIQKYASTLEKHLPSSTSCFRHSRSKGRCWRQSLLIGGLFGIYVGLSNGFHFPAMQI